MAELGKRMEYRYYEMPQDSYVLPLLGERWETEYGVGRREILHFHNYMEIGYCYRGEGELVVEDLAWPYRGGMFSILPANIPHTTNSAPGSICKWEFLFLDIESFVLHEMRLDAQGARSLLASVSRQGLLLSKESHEAAAGLILSILRECRDTPPYYKESVKGYLYALVIEMLRLSDGEESQLSLRPINAYLRNALDFIQRHYAEQVRVRDIAKASGLSESHFRRIFEDVMKMTPLDYVNLVRVERARALMEREDVSAWEAGFRVGFQTQSTFQRNFKSRMGCSPREWKRDCDKRRAGQSHADAMEGW